MQPWALAPRLTASNPKQILRKTNQLLKFLCGFSSQPWTSARKLEGEHREAGMGLKISGTHRQKCHRLGYREVYFLIKSVIKTRGIHRRQDGCGTFCSKYEYLSLLQGQTGEVPVLSLYFWLRWFVTPWDQKFNILRLLLSNQAKELSYQTVLFTFCFSHHRTTKSGLYECV